MFHPSDAILKIAITVAFTFCSTVSIQAEAATWNINQPSVTSPHIKGAGQGNLVKGLVDKTGDWIDGTAQAAAVEFKALGLTSKIKNARSNSHSTRSSIAKKMPFSKNSKISAPAIMLIFAFLGIVFVLRISNSEV